MCNRRASRCRLCLPQCVEQGDEAIIRVDDNVAVELAAAAICVAAGLFALFPGPAKATLVQPLFINVDETIVWSTPSPFPGATLIASSQFETATSSFGAHSYDIVYPPNPAIPPGPTIIFLPAVQINWGDSIAWRFEGNMETAVASFPNTACAAGVLHPPQPCTPATIGTDLIGGFAPIDVSGGVFTFDQAVGTWEIKVAQVPEPSSLMLFGVGLASLPAFRRWLARHA
jgi:hypothetical protein